AGESRSSAWSRRPARIRPALLLGGPVHLGCRLAEIALVDDVVPLEDRAGLVSGELHRHALGDAASDHVPDRRAPEVMGNPAGEPRVPAGAPPRAPEVLDGPAASMEDPGDDPARLSLDRVRPGPLGVQEGGQLDGKRKLPGLLVLSVPGLQP